MGKVAVKDTPGAVIAAFLADSRIFGGGDDRADHQVCHCLSAAPPGIQLAAQLIRRQRRLHAGVRQPQARQQVAVGEDADDPMRAIHHGQAAIGLSDQHLDGFRDRRVWPHGAHLAAHQIAHGRSGPQGAQPAMTVGDDFHLLTGDQVLGYQLGQARHHARHARRVIHPLDNQWQLGGQIDDAGRVDAAMCAQSGQARNTVAPAQSSDLSSSRIAIYSDFGPQRSFSLA